MVAKRVIQNSPAPVERYLEIARQVALSKLKVTAINMVPKMEYSRRVKKRDYKTLYRP
jgi:hypothetical protein